MIWTKPYCGVQHLDDLPHGWQISLEDHGTFTHVYVLHGGFSAKAEADFPTVAEAMQWGEMKARAI